MIPNIQFTGNFNLHEMLSSQTATRYSFTEQFEPPADVIENLRVLSINILQPLRDHIGIPIRISSGYRCLRVNQINKGAKESQHMKGQAADIQCFQIGNENLYKAILEMQLPFDQLIDEYNFSWVHVSYDPNRTRKQILKIG